MNAETGAAVFVSSLEAAHGVRAYTGRSLSRGSRYAAFERSSCPNPPKRCQGRKKNCDRRRLGASADLGRATWVRPGRAVSYRAGNFVKKKAIAGGLKWLVLDAQRGTGGLVPATGFEPVAP